MRRLAPVFLFLLSFIAIERFCYIQTAGFRIAKIQADDEESSPITASLPKEIFNCFEKPFVFLGSGVQCYAFESQDQTIVLKVFKHFHAGVPNKELEKWSFSPWKEKIDQIVYERRARMSRIYQSCHLASKRPEETALMYTHLQKTSSLKKTITLLDRIGTPHLIDLDTTPFIIQRKAILALPYLTKKIEQGDDLGAKRAIQAVIELIETRCKQGIANTDPVFHRNFGFLEDRPVEIDVGSFVSNPYLAQERMAKQTLFYEAECLRNWLRLHFPHLENVVEEALAAHLHLSVDRLQRRAILPCPNEGI